MRLTVLRQQALGVNAKQILETIERIKHYLWHGNVFQALQHIEFLQMDVDCIEDRTAVGTRCFCRRPMRLIKRER
jgi:hypothetical protein